MHVAQNWRLNNQRYALKGVRCETCGRAQFPPREVCPHCASKRVETYQLEQQQIVELPEPVEMQRAAR